MKNIIIAGTCAVFFALPTFADSRVERLEVARDYVETTLEDIDMREIIKSMWKPVVQQVEADGKTLSPEQLDKINALYQDTFTEPMYKIMRQQIEVIADVFTLEEVTAMRDFYKTEYGRAAMLKLPILIEKQQPMIQSLVQEQVPGILPKLLAILDE